MDLPRRSYKLTDVRLFVRLLPAFLGIGSLVFSDFWHKDAKWQCPKYDRARFSRKIFFWPKLPELCRKNWFFGIFSRFHHCFFLIFCSKMRIRNAQNGLVWFLRKIFFQPKVPEICRKSLFLQIFLRLFPYFSLFFHTKTLLITMPTIKHGSIVNKTDFCSRNFLKIAGTADFRRKNGISWISRAVLNIFSWNFAHWCKMAIRKMLQSLIFEKDIF